MGVGSRGPLVAALAIAAVASGCYEEHVFVPTPHPEVGPRAARDAESFLAFRDVVMCRAAIEREAADAPPLTGSSALAFEFPDCDPRGRRTHSPRSGYASDDALFDAIEAGRLGFDPEEAASCRALLEGRTVPSIERNACRRVFVPMVGDRACESYIECRSGHCRADGTCEGDPTPPGAECGAEHACTLGFGCFATAWGERRCQLPWAQPQEGEPCGPAASCAPGLRCHSMMGRAVLRCARLPSEGEACATDHACAPPFVCSRRVIMPDGGRCVRGLGPGEACDLSRPCGRGLRCADGACRTIVLPSEACDADRVCPLSYRCEAGACAPLHGAGEACESDGDCLGSTCAEGRCRARDEGEPCSAFFVGGTCAERCANARCAPRGHEGDACDPDAGLAPCDEGLRCLRSTRFRGVCVRE